MEIINCVIIVYLRLPDEDLGCSQTVRRQEKEKRNVVCLNLLTFPRPSLDRPCVHW